MLNPSALLRIIFVLGILFLIDLYAYQPFRTLFKDSLLSKYLYWGTSVIMLLAVLYVIFTFDRSKPQPTYFQYFAGALILFLVPKLVLLFIMLSEDVIRFFVGLGGKVSGSQSEQFMPDRRKFVSTLALGLASIPFLGIIHGIWRGRYNYRVVRKTLHFANLPVEFDGLTITQISDIHSGSFDNAEKIQYGIELINAQQSDLILFTGDLVNNRAEEMEPWIDLFKELKAPLGKFSILGNHDYGDYVLWPSDEAKQKNMERLYDIHKELGFRLLRNESISLSREEGKIDLVGVENWGLNFHQYGDLDKATAGLQPETFKILMSHDPTHFDEHVKKHPQDIELTLSGHTHGMQFGIEIPGFIKWSPVSLRYAKWAGLYESMGKHLYINRGFGFLAFPGRVGIWPEVTVLELKRA